MTEWNSLPPEDVPRPAPPEPAFPVAGTPPPLPPPDPLVQCWRCNKQTSALKSRCVYCDATVVSQRVLPPVPFEGQPLPPVESPADPAQVICWRCGKSNSVERSHCAFCSAAVVRPQAEPANPSEANLYAWLDSLPAPTTPPPPPFYYTPDAKTPHAVAVIRLVVFFGILQLSTIILFRIAAEMEHHARGATEQQMLQMVTIFEVLDGIAILVALAAVSIPARPAPPPSPLLGWVAAPFLWLLALGLATAYQWVLQRIINLPPDFDLRIVRDEQFFWWHVVTICVFPAIFEELFFRQLALSTLRCAMNVHGAIIVSSVMFGTAHIGNPLGIPLLMVIGMILAYARVWTGSLLAPMAIHFSYNFAIVLMEKLGW